METDDYVEQIMETMYEYHGGPIHYNELHFELESIMPEFDGGELGSAIDLCIEKGMIRAEMGPDGLGVFNAVQIDS